jgi:hypothetical protein
MGRRAHLPGPVERRQVEAMAGYGVPETDIARVLGIDPKALRKHYRDELDTGHIVANAKVAESLFRKATGDHRQAVTAAIFWLKTRAGWKEPSAHEPEPAASGAVIDSARAQLAARLDALALRMREGAAGSGLSERQDGYESTSRVG